MLNQERLIEIASGQSVRDVFSKAKEVINSQSLEERQNLLNNESVMNFLTAIVQGFDGKVRLQKATELANSFGEDNFQNLEAYDYFSKALGLQTSLR